MPVNELADNALLTLEEARLYCWRNAGDASRDELLIDNLNDVSTSIEAHCGREFSPRTGATELAAPIDDNDVTFTVPANPTGFPSSGDYVVRIDSELLLVTAGHGSTTWTVTRGYLGSTAAAHLAGAAVVELEARVFRYPGAGTLDLDPFDLLDLERVTLYTDLADTALHDELAAASYRLQPAGGFPGSNTFLSLKVPYPALDEAEYGFGWQATVLGRWGMLEVPGDVKLAAKLWLDNIVQNPTAASSRAMNGYTIVPELDNDERRAGMPASARYRLERWIRPGGTGGGRAERGTVRFTNQGAGYPPATPYTLPTP